MQGELKENEQQRIADVFGELNKRGLTTVKDGVIQPKKVFKPINAVTAAELEDLDMSGIVA